MESSDNAQELAWAWKMKRLARKRSVEPNSQPIYQVGMVEENVVLTMKTAETTPSGARFAESKDQIQLCK